MRLARKQLNQSCIVYEENKGVLITEIGGDSWKASPDCKETHCKTDAQNQTGAAWPRGAEAPGALRDTEETMTGR